MTTIAGLIGSGAGVVALGVAVLLGGFVAPRCPRFLRPWLERFIVVLMYAGGAAIAVTTLGSWSDWILSHAADLLGGLNAPIPQVALILTGLFLVLVVIASLIWEPNAATGIVAAFLPLLLGLVAGGFIHAIYLETVIPGRELASAVSSWVGGLA